jgi:hypothetical protein
MDVLFLLLDDNADVIDIATTLILADEDSDNDEGSPCATTYRVGWFPSWQGTRP